MHPPSSRPEYKWEWREGCRCVSCPWKGRCQGETYGHWIEVRESKDVKKKTDVNKPIIITNSVLQLIAEEPLHQFDPDQWMIAYKALSVCKLWCDYSGHIRRGIRLVPPMRDVDNFFYYKNKWKEELGACVDPSLDCAPGLHLATKSWLHRQFDMHPWYEAHFQYKDIACVPKKYSIIFLNGIVQESDIPIVVGKFRVFRFKLGKHIKRKV